MKLRKGLITTLFIATIMLFSGYIFVTTAFFQIQIQKKIYL